MWSRRTPHLLPDLSTRRRREHCKHHNAQGQGVWVGARRWAVSDAPISSVATGRPNQLRPRVQEAGPDVAIDRREERGSLP